MNSWIQLFSWLIDSKKPFYLLKYEDLLQHPVDEIRKVMEFLKAKSGFEPANLEQRLLCMSENLQGMYKRKSRKLKEFLYTEKMKTKIDSIIKDARLILSSADDNLKLPNYEPIIWNRYNLNMLGHGSPQEFIFLREEEIIRRATAPCTKEEGFNGKTERFLNRGLISIKKFSFSLPLAPTQYLRVKIS